MKFKIENLGIVKSAEIELSDFTLICGENNTGKTYIAYSIYGFLEQYPNLIGYNPALEESVVEKDLDKGLLKINLIDYINKTKTYLRDKGN